MDTASNGLRQSAHVLVVNDDLEARDTIRLRLKRAGVKNISAPNSLNDLRGMLAGQLPNSPSHFELIILDYIFVGWASTLAEVLNVFKSSTSAKDSKIVILTAFKPGADSNPLIKGRYTTYSYRDSDQSTIDDIVESNID